MEGEQKQRPEHSSEPSSSSSSPSSQSEPIQPSKRLKKSDDDSTVPSLAVHTRETSEGRTSVHYQDTAVNEPNTSYRSFVASKTKPSASASLNLVQKILSQASTDLDSDDEDEQKKKIAAAKKLLFPNALATSFPEVSDTLRNERRQEFCPIYQDETPEQVALRLAKRKPLGSLLSKRIRWDDLKRKRDEEEEKAQMQFRYGSYGPIQDNQTSFTNPYEQYYTAMQNHYDLMFKMSHAQQEHSGFWPEYQQPPYANNDQISQSTWQQQAQPYMYPSTNYNHLSGMNSNLPASYPSTDYYQLQYLRNMQPPPPPPDEP